MPVRVAVQRRGLRRPRLGRAGLRRRPRAGRGPGGERRLRPAAAAPEGPNAALLAPW